MDSNAAPHASPTAPWVRIARSIAEAATIIREIPVNWRGEVQAQVRYWALALGHSPSSVLMLTLLMDSTYRGGDGLLHETNRSCETKLGFSRNTVEHSFKRHRNDGLVARVRKPRSASGRGSGYDHWEGAVLALADAYYSLRAQVQGRPEAACNHPPEVGCNHSPKIGDLVVVVTEQGTQTGGAEPSDEHRHLGGRYARVAAKWRRSAVSEAELPEIRAKARRALDGPAELVETALDVGMARAVDRLERARQRRAGSDPASYMLQALQGEAANALSALRACSGDPGRIDALRAASSKPRRSSRVARMASAIKNKPQMMGAKDA